MPGAVVRNETVPSGLWREATSVFHSPKSNTVATPAWPFVFEATM
jgi:hypothetical protein